MSDAVVSSKPVSRFAPSPNGYLHLGHALSALTCAHFAQSNGGRFLLRIEDIDVDRCRAEYEQAIYKDLAWLGLSWEEPALRQSERFDAYRIAAKRLTAAGLLYPCFASRTDIASAAAAKGVGCDPDGALLYPGLHKSLSIDQVEAFRRDGRPFAMRIDMAAAIQRLENATGNKTLEYRAIDSDGSVCEKTTDPSRWGDAVIVRKDVPTSYHLSVVVDDAFQGVTHVVRGRDLQAATDIHRLLQWLLGLPAPLYHHHDLLLDQMGQKLSKAIRSTSLRDLREDGVTPEAIRRRLGF